MFFLNPQLNIWFDFIAIHHIKPDEHGNISSLAHFLESECLFNPINMLFDVLLVWVIWY